MRKFIIVLFFSFYCLFAKAQIQNVCGSDTIILQADNYEVGIIEWQESIDSLTWVTIPEVTGITYKFLPTQTKYYRALVKTSTCEPLPSAITLVQVRPKADAGIDRVIGDTKMTLSGNRVTGAKGEWKIISGIGGSIADNTNPCMEFSGVYNESYKLVWTLSNLCGQATDTVTVTFKELVINKKFIVVDNTDKILSDSAAMVNGLYKIKFSDPSITPTDSVLLIGMREDITFLRKVNSFTYIDSTYTFITEQGYLDDLIVSGTLNIGDGVNQAILGGALKQASSLSARQSVKQSSNFPTRQTVKEHSNNKGLLVLYSDFPVNRQKLPAMNSQEETGIKTYVAKIPNKIIFESPDEGFKISIENSYVSFTPNFVSDYTKSFFPFALKNINVGLNNALIDYSYTTKYESSSAFKKNLEEKIIFKEPHNIYFMAFGAPVIVNATFKIKASGNVGVSSIISLEDENHYLTNLTALLKGDTDKNLDFYSDQTSTTTRELRFKAKAEMTGTLKIGPEVSISLYGLIGPYFNLPIKLESELCVNSNANWKANTSVGLTGNVGVRGNFGLFKYDKEFELFSAKKEFKFPAKLELLSGNGQKGTMGQILSNPISLKVLSSTGVGVPFVPVRFDLESGSGSLKNNVLFTDISGKVSTDWTLGSNAICKLKAYVQDCDNEDIQNSPIEITASTSATSDIYTNSDLQILIMKGQTYATGGTPPYTCSRDGISYSSNFPVFSSSSPGKYTVYAKDKNGCTVMRSFTINASTPCDNSNLNLDVLKQANTVQLSGKNGIPPYLYSVDDQNNFTTNRFYSKLSVGSHEVFVKDANGCIFTSSIKILAENGTTAIAPLYPANGANYISVAGLILGWQAGAYASDQMYDLYLRKGSEDFTKIAENISATKYSYTGTLANASTYTWKVSVKDGSGVEKDYALFTFTTATSNTTTLAVPTILQPANGSTSSYLPIKLAWSSQTGDFKYDLYLDDANASRLIANNLTANEYSVNGLTPGKKYFWKVKIKNMVTGEYKESAVWNFTPSQPSDAFITKWNLPAGSFTLPLAATGTYNCTVDWGDGTSGQITGYDDPDRIHNYASATICNIAINGTFSKINFQSQKQLIEVVNWGNVGFTDLTYAFQNCTSLSKLPEGSITGAKSVTHFSFCFYGCSGLTSIPNELFSANPNVTDFSGCFYFCSGLTSIPNELFIANPNVTDFDFCFAGCIGLTSIPNELFSSNPNVTNFKECFAGCIGLTSIPNGLFSANTKATDFSFCFSGCSGLTFIPNGLFSANPNVTNFEDCFKGCSGLTSIPNGLFSANPNVINFKFCFAGCSGLTSIPNELFSANPNVTNFEDCFKSCFGLTSIPNGLFSANPNVTSFEDCFNGCVGLTSIPNGLFSANPNVTSFSRCFYWCTGLTSIPNGLFNANPNVTNFYGCFDLCYKLTGNAPELWLRSNVPSGGSCFYGCTGLSNYASIPDSWK
jgi:hypothetical protein